MVSFVANTFDRGLIGMCRKAETVGIDCPGPFVIDQSILGARCGPVVEGSPRSSAPASYAAPLIGASVRRWDGIHWRRTGHQRGTTCGTNIGLPGCPEGIRGHSAETEDAGRSAGAHRLAAFQTSYAGSIPVARSYGLTSGNGVHPRQGRVDAVAVRARSVPDGVGRAFSDEVVGDGLSQGVSVVVDVLGCVDGQPGLLLALVEHPEVLLAAVNPEASDGLAVVVVEQHAEVGLGVAGGDAIDADLAADGRAHDLPPVRAGPVQPAASTSTGPTTPRQSASPGGARGQRSATAARAGQAVRPLHLCDQVPRPAEARRIASCHEAADLGRSDDN